MNPNRTSRLLWGATLLTIASSPASAGQPTLHVSASASTYELFPSLSFAVVGEGVRASRPRLNVLADDTDITTTVTVVAQEESFEDPDQDGIAEDYSGIYEVQLNGYHLAPGQLLRVIAAADSPTGNMRAQSATQVQSHVRVFVDDTLEAGDPRVHVGVMMQELRVRSQRLMVSLNGTDMTSLIGIGSPELASESVDTGTPVYVRHRMQRYWLDLSALGAGATGTLVVSVSAIDARGESTSGTSTSNLVRAEPTPEAPLDPLQLQRHDAGAAGAERSCVRRWR